MMSAVGTGNDGIADLQAVGGDDIAFLAVFILHQRDMSGTVGVVLQGQDRERACPALSLLKSITRYFLLLPPPR